MTPDSMPDLFPLYAGIMPDIILCRILLTDDAGSNAGFDAGFVPSLCRNYAGYNFCRILLTDDAGVDAGFIPSSMPEFCRISISCRILLTADAG
jgi:hypothetical protein